MSVLVTGGTGYIGSHTVVKLLEANYDVVIVDNLSNSKIEVLQYIEQITKKKPKFYQCDIKDFNALNKIFKENSIEEVIHFAGLKAVGESCIIPLDYYENNISGSLNLYRCMKLNKVKKLVFSSSATVYGDPISVPIKEDFALSTTNPYGTTKLMNEQILNDLYRADPTFRVMILRYFNPIGAHESGLIGEVPNGTPNNLLPYVAKVANRELEYLHVFGDDYNTVDGTGVRDYIHVDDLAKGHILALDYLKNHQVLETVNLGTGRGYSVLEVVKAYELASGKDVPYKIEARRPGDIATCFADPTKAFNLLGFKAQYDLARMCQDSWRFTLNNNNH